MHPRRVLSGLVLPSTALSLPSTPIERRAVNEATQTCLLVESPTTPINPPECWSWYVQTSEPADYCGLSSLDTIGDIMTSVNWVDDCSTIRNSLLSTPRDLLLVDYSTTQFNTLLSEGNCGFEVKPKQSPTSDPIYIGGRDLTDILRTAIQTSQEGQVGVGGLMTCYSYPLEWRVVPV